MVRLWVVGKPSEVIWVRGSHFGLEGQVWIDPLRTRRELSNPVLRLRLRRDAMRIRYTPTKRLLKLRDWAIKEAQRYSEDSAFLHMYTFYIYHAQNELAKRAKPHRKR